MPDARKLSYILSLTDDSSGAIKSADDAVEKLHGRFTGLAAAGATAAIGLAAVATEAVGLATALFALGEQTDAAFDKIRIGTGATGEAFKGLQEQTLTALVDVPTNLDKASTAVTVLNQRLGEGGKERQQLVEDILELSRLTGTDLSTNLTSSAQIFRSWNVAAEDQSEVLDKLLRGYQATGTSVTTLGSTVSELGPIFRTLGLGLSESIALTGALEREGVQTEVVMRGFNTAIGKLAEQGIAAADALPDLLASIRDMQDPTEATGLAIELFGARAGPKLAEAIRSGRLEISGLLQDIDGGSETVRKLGEDTDDAAQLMEKAWGRVQVAAKPATTAVFDFATTILNTATPAVEDFAKNLENIEELLKRIGDRRIKWEDVLGLSGGEAAKAALKGIIPTANLDAIGQTVATIGETLDRIGRENVGNEVINSGGIFITRAQAEENLRIASEANAQYLAGLQQTAADSADIVEDGNKNAGALAGGTYNQALVDALKKKPGPEEAVKEQSIQIAETAIDGFIAAMSANRANLVDQFGEFGSSAAIALQTALVENTKSSGASVFREVENIVLKLQKEGVPNWRELGDEYAAAFHDSLISGTADAANAALDNAAAVLKAHRALTPENLSASLTEALNLQSLGSGAGVMESLTKAIDEGGEQARQALARQAAGWIAEVRNGLPPERAQEIIDDFTAALAAAAEDNSEETRTALEDMFRSVRFEIPMAALDAQLTDAENRIRQTRDEALAAAAESRRISDDIAGRRAGLREDQKGRMDALVATFPDESLRRAEDAAQRIADTQAKGQEAVNDARFRGDTLATLKAMKQAEDAIKAINDQTKREEAQVNQRKLQEQAVGALRETFSRENANLEATLAQEAYDRNLQQIRDRAEKELTAAQDKYDKDVAHLNDTLGIIQTVTTAADAMFDGALDDITAIVAQSSTLAQALALVTPGGLGGVNQAAAAEAQGLGQRAVNIQNLNVTNNGYMGEGGPEALAAEMVQAEEALIQ